MVTSGQYVFTNCQDPESNQDYGYEDDGTTMRGPSRPPTPSATRVPESVYSQTRVTETVYSETTVVGTDHGGTDHGGEIFGGLFD